MIAVKRVELGPHHRDLGTTKHTLVDSHGLRSFPPFVSLEITRWSEPDDDGFYLMHICADGSAADTWHESLEDAFHQAEFELGVHPDEWTDCNEPF
ncbi:MAG TPA: hypothetical protein VIM62_08490 [Acidobacteriaceae bacterium]